jgi:hypothetical protein
LRSGRGRRFAAISWNGAREEERRSVPVVLMRCAAAMNKREVGSPPMRNCMGGRPCNPGGQNVLEKKRLHPKMEPYESGANGRGRRKRRLPLDLTEGGGFSSVQCLCSAGPREEGSVRRLSDRLNMLAPVLFGNAWVRMSAMRPVRGRSAYLTHFVAGGRMARSAVSHKLSKAESRNARKSLPVL